MTQTITPDGTVAVGSAWSAVGAASLHAATATLDDGTSYAATGSAFLPGSAPQYMELSLSNPAGDPIKHTDHDILIRMSRTGVGTFATMPVVEVYQGTSLIYGPTTLTDYGVVGYVTETLSLSTDEAANITDYSDLRIRIQDPVKGTGVAGLRLTYAALTLPDAHSLSATTDIDTEVTLAFTVANDVMHADTDCDTEVTLALLAAVDVMQANVDCDTEVTLSLLAAVTSMAADVDCETSVTLVLAVYGDLVLEADTDCDTSVSLVFTKTVSYISGTRITVASPAALPTVACPGY